MQSALRGVFPRKNHSLLVRAATRPTRLIHSFPGSVARRRCVIPASRIRRIPQACRRGQNVFVAAENAALMKRPPQFMAKEITLSGGRAFISFSECRKQLLADCEREPDVQARLIVWTCCGPSTRRHTPRDFPAYVELCSWRSAESRAVTNGPSATGGAEVLSSPVTQRR